MTMQGRTIYPTIDYFLPPPLLKLFVCLNAIIDAEFSPLGRNTNF